jgi:hypothetical protein
VRISGDVEEEVQENSRSSDQLTLNARASVDGKPAVEIHGGRSTARSTTGSQRVKRTGSESIHLNFGTIGTGLNSLINVLGTPRLWLLIDEWSEVPVELQPYLADLLRRTVLPISALTLKLAAIEHRSNFAILKATGDYIGPELGADISADLNLDDFLVFDNNQGKATAFFKALIYRHYQVSDEGRSTGINADTLIQVTFTQFQVFEEFVRAVEGVPRDALNLAAKIMPVRLSARGALNRRCVATSYSRFL